MKCLIFLFSFCTLSLNAQLDSIVYKSFSDSVFRVGDRIIISKVKFDLSRGGRMIETSKDSIKIITDFLNQHPNLIIEIGRHTDSRGSDEVNQRLSERQAENIKYYLIKDFDIDESRILTKGYGESQLLVKEDGSEKTYRINRRTEIKIIEIK